MTKYLPKPSLTKQYADLVNSWIGRRRKLSVNWNTINYVIEPFYVSNATEVAYTIQFELNDTLLEFHFKKFPPLEFFDSDLMGLTLDDLDGDLRYLMLDIIATKAEELFANIFKNKLIYRAMTFENVQLEQQNLVGLVLKSSKKYNENETVFFKATNKNILQTLITSLPAVENKKWLNIPINFKIILGYIELSRNDLRGVKIGDILLIDKQHNVSENLIRIYYANKYFVCSVKNKTLITILSAMEEDNNLPVGIIPDEEIDDSTILDEINEGDASVKEQNDAAQEEQNIAKAKIDDLPVRITFDIGEKIFALSELKAISEGYTFEIDRPIDECIHVRANGKCIAVGELVSIHERMGVRITQFK